MGNNIQSDANLVDEQSKWQKIRERAIIQAKSDFEKMDLQKVVLHEAILDGVLVLRPGASCGSKGHIEHIFQAIDGAVLVRVSKEPDKLYRTPAHNIREEVHGLPPKERPKIKIDRPIARRPKKVRTKKPLDKK